MSDIEAIIEALLFSTDESLSVVDFKKIIQESSQTIQQAIKKLNTSYEANKNSFEIVLVAGGYLLRTKKEFSPWIKKNQKLKKQVLRKSAIETLSLIAYKQPISKQSINKIRQLDSSGTIRNLLEKELIKIAGRSTTIGKPLLYGTSNKFLEMLGLKKLSDLPQLEESDYPDNLEVSE